MLRQRDRDAFLPELRASPSRRLVQFKRLDLPGEAEVRARNRRILRIIIAGGIAVWVFNSVARIVTQDQDEGRSGELEIQNFSPEED